MNIIFEQFYQRLNYETNFPFCKVILTFYLIFTLMHVLQSDTYALDRSLQMSSLNIQENYTTFETSALEEYTTFIRKMSCRDQPVNEVRRTPAEICNFVRD